MHAPQKIQKMVWQRRFGSIYKKVKSAFQSYVVFRKKRLLPIGGSLRFLLGVLILGWGFGIDLIAISVCLFDLIQCLVRFFVERLEIGAVLTSQDNTDRSAHFNILFPLVVHLAQQMIEFLDALFKCRDIAYIVREYDKFITAEPANDIIFAEEAAQGVGCFLQNHITHSMPHAVIDLFEMV